MKLTLVRIDNLKCPPGKRDMLVFDDEQRGLALRVTSSGGKSFLAQYTSHGQKHRIPLGSCSGISLTKARDAVCAIQSALRRPEQALVFTSGSAVFGVFNGGEETRVVYDEDSRAPLPASTFAPASAGVHPLLVAGFGDAMAARVETEQEVLRHAGTRGIVIRPGLVYGRGGSYDVPAVISRARERGQLVVRAHAVAVGHSRHPVGGPGDGVVAGPARKLISG